jgi:hypothetical protein
LSFPSTTAKLAGTIKQVQSEADATFFFSVDFTLLFRAPIPMPASLNEPEKCPRTRRHVPSSSEATAMFLQPVKSIHSASSIALFLFVWPVGWLQPSSRSLTPYFQRAWILTACPLTCGPGSTCWMAVCIHTLQYFDVSLESFYLHEACAREILCNRIYFYL